MNKVYNTSKVKIGKINKYIFLAEKINNRRNFAFVSSSFFIDYNLRLLKSSKSQSVQDIDFTIHNIIRFINFGKFIIVFRHGNTSQDREMYFIDYQLKESQILLMDEIFHRKELIAILALRQKMMETYDGREKNIASVASIYN